MGAEGTSDVLTKPDMPQARRSGLSARDFQLFQRLIHREAGIHLVESKRVLVEGRLSRRLRELALDFRGYYALLETDEAERVRLVDAISTNETHFFREPRQFDFLESRVFPEWAARAAAGRMSRRVRVWSAACSTGEEPYSVAMSFLACFPSGSGWEIDVLATDISTRVLDRARSALYALDKSKEIPPRYLKAFMLKGTGEQEGWMKAGPEIRSVVRFGRVNLNDDALAVTGQFDLILCRNVLIYFDAPSKARVVERLLERLDVRGYLFLGHAEAMLGTSHKTRSVGPTVYTHAAPSGIPDEPPRKPDASRLVVAASQPVNPEESSR